MVISLFSPFQYLLAHSTNKVQNVWNQYFLLVGVHKNNKNLQEEINKLKNEALKHVEDKKAFERLSKMLEYKLATEKEMVLATVIGKDPLGWSKMLTIDRGTSDGVRKNMAVVTYEGLVGHIVQALPDYSKVLLITDARSAVDAIEQNNRTRGVVAGTGSDICEMNYISRDAHIEIGYPVISSGLGGVFPKGILIGKVSKVDKVKRGLFQNVVITPAVKIEVLEEVFVLK